MQADFRARLVSGACGEFEDLVSVVNQVPSEEFPNPEVLEAVRTCLDALADGGTVTTKELQALKDVLEPALERGMKQMRAQLFGPIFTTDAPSMRRKPWVGAGLIPRSQTGNRPEDMLVVAFWRLLDAINSADGSLGVKRCLHCKTLFMDESRDQRARYCSNKCTLRARAAR